MRIAASFASCLVGALATCVSGQDTKPTGRPTKDKHDIKMDALSRTTLDRWEAMEYHPGRAGLKTVSFTIKVVSKSLLGEAEATGEYTFTDKKSSLKWDNPALGDMLAMRGWSKQTFDRMFVGDSRRQAIKNTELSAKKSEDGSTTLTVKGKTQGGYKSFTFNRDGIATKFTIMVSDPATGEVDATIRVTYDKIGKKFVRNGWSYDMDLAMGAFRAKVTVTSRKIGKHHVYGRVIEKVIMDGENVSTSVLTFSNYKINGAKGRAKPKPGPNSQPAQKPGLRAIKQLKKKG